MERRMAYRLEGPVAPVVGVVRGVSHGGGGPRLVIATERNVYVTRGGFVRASFPGAVLERHPIETVDANFYRGAPLSTLTVDSDEVRFLGQHRRAMAIMDAVIKAQS
jgi:hypothetical protein